MTDFKSMTQAQIQELELAMYRAQAGVEVFTAQHSCCPLTRWDAARYVDRLKGDESK